MYFSFESTSRAVARVHARPRSVRTPLVLSRSAISASTRPPGPSLVCVTLSGLPLLSSDVVQPKESGGVAHVRDRCHAGGSRTHLGRTVTRDHQCAARQFAAYRQTMPLSGTI